MRPVQTSARAPLTAPRGSNSDWKQPELKLSDFTPNDPPNSALFALTRKVKDELIRRFERGERPTAAEYLARHPEIAADRDRAVSLIYEEYCLREEHDEPPIPEEFCRRYDAWRDSLASQLRYHRLLSSVLEPKPPVRYPKPGDSFAGRFILRTLLGEGGTARVFLAEQPDMGSRRVALKVTASTGREPAILGRLDDDHIIPVWSVDDDPGTGLRGLCMPYRPGLPLDRVLKRLDPTAPRALASSLWKVIQDPTEAAEPDPSRRPGWRGFPARGSYPEGAAWVAMVIARALAHAHQRGILHRDIKPANTLLTVAGGPQLLDFNLADSDEDDPANAQQAMQGGTLPYMAPEQLQAFLDPKRWDRVGPPADLYSLGLVLREMLTGERPPAPPKELPLPRLINELLDLRARPHRSTREGNPQVPHALAAIVAKCLAHETADRYSDAAALADDLERYLHQRPLRYAVNPSRRERSLNCLYRNRLRLVTAGGLVIVGVLIQQGTHALAIASEKANKGNRALAIARQEAAVSGRKLAERWLDEHENAAKAVKQDPGLTQKLAEVRAQFESDARSSPDDYGAHLNLAHIDSTFPDENWSPLERLERPLDRLDQALAIIQRSTDVKPKLIAESFLNRSVIRLQLGDVIERSQQEARDPATFYQGAIDDTTSARDMVNFLDAFRRIRLLYVAANARTRLARLLANDRQLNTAETLYMKALDDLAQLDRLIETCSTAHRDSSLSDSEILRGFSVQSGRLRSDIQNARSRYAAITELSY